MNTNDMSQWLTHQHITRPDVEAIAKRDFLDASSTIRGTAKGTRLLTPPDGNAKSTHTLDAGWATWMLMLHADVADVPLAPPNSLVIHTEPMVLCPHATHGPSGCADGCISFTGRGSMDSVQQGRLKRTAFLRQDPVAFVAMLDWEIGLARAWAHDQGLRPAVRLNGLSDLRWEVIIPWLFDKYPDVQFYDYTKWPIRVRDKNLPANYLVAYSSQAHCDEYETMMNLHADGYSVAMIVDDVDAWEAFMGDSCSRADVSDLWMVDRPGTIGLLRPKSPLTADHPTVWGLHR